MTNEVLSPVSLHAGTAIAEVLLALNGRAVDMPAEALNELRAHNERLIANPSEEIEATLRRQAVLLEHVEIAYLRKAATTTRPDHAALYGGVAIRANGALLNVLAALKAMDDAKRKARAIEG